MHSARPTVVCVLVATVLRFGSVSVARAEEFMQFMPYIRGGCLFPLEVAALVSGSDVCNVELECDDSEDYTHGPLRPGEKVIILIGYANE